MPQGAIGDQRLVDRLLELPGFDDTAFIKTMGCTSNKRFDVWQSWLTNPVNDRSAGLCPDGA